LNKIYKTQFHLKFYIKLAENISNLRKINDVGLFIQEREKVLNTIKNIGDIERKEYYLNMVENIQREKRRKLGWILNDMSIAKLKIDIKREKLIEKK